MPLLIASVAAVWLARAREMDGREFARGPRAQWLPWPGRHVVQLAGAQGQVLDEIRIEVRGAGVRDGVKKISAP